jgi:hypothetical protein
LVHVVIVVPNGARFSLWMLLQGSRSQRKHPSSYNDKYKIVLPTGKLEQRRNSKRDMPDPEAPCILSELPGAWGTAALNKLYGLIAIRSVRDW